MARSYGFRTDRRTACEPEAETLREAARRALADGGSLTAAVRWLNEHGKATATGRQWELITLRRVLTSERVAGLVPGVEGILTPEVREQLVEKLGNRTATVAEPYLLTGGIGLCGLCGTALTASKSYRAGAAGSRKVTRAYVCPPARGVTDRRRGCGRIRVAADPLEDHVATMVLARLAKPANAAAVAQAIRDEETRAAELRSEIDAARVKLGELAREWAYAAGPASATYRPVREALQKTIRDNEATLRRMRLLAGAPVFDQEHLARSRPVAGVARVTNPDRLADWWQAAGNDQRRALLALLVKRVTVSAAPVRGARTFDARRVRIVWR